MLHTFASIAEPNTIGYAYDSESWVNHAQVSSNFRMFQTYGDGLTQHSGDHPITTDYTTDYLMSLAVSMLASDELTERLYYTLMREPSIAEIEFAASVVFKPMSDEQPWEKKTRYYSVEQKKITTNSEKAHDKRYNRVEAKHTGQHTAIYDMLVPYYADGLQMLLYANAIHRWAMKTEGQWMPLPLIFLKWIPEEYSSDNQTKARESRDAVDLIRNVCESWRTRTAATAEIQQYREKIERRQIAAQAENYKD